jgi:hypothetical protein
VFKQPYKSTHATQGQYAPACPYCACEPPAPRQTLRLAAPVWACTGKARTAQSIGLHAAVTHTQAASQHPANTSKNVRCMHAEALTLSLAMRACTLACLRCSFLKCALSLDISYTTLLTCSLSTPVRYAATCVPAQAARCGH